MGRSANESNRNMLRVSTVSVPKLVVEAARRHRLSGNLSRISMQKGILSVGLADVDNRMVLVITVIRDKLRFLDIRYTEVT